MKLCATAAGLTVGDPVLRRKQPLSVELGPGIMGTIFDGIQRPLEYIARGSGDVFVPRGVDVPALDRHTQWQYTPQVRVGDLISGGDVFGTVRHCLIRPASLSCAFGSHCTPRPITTGLRERDHALAQDHVPAERLWTRRARVR